MEDKINDDLKQAMLAKDTQRVTVLRAIKSAITYAKVAPGSAGTSVALDDNAVLAIVSKEAKKRQESADSYTAAGSRERADAELSEKAIIEEYLPAQLGEDELLALVKEAIAGLDEVSPKAMGQVISQVKAKAGTAADGATVARLAKQELAK